MRVGKDCPHYKDSQCTASKLYLGIEFHSCQCVCSYCCKERCLDHMGQHPDYWRFKRYIRMNNIDKLIYKLFDNSGY
jgi:hypothetical protein